MTEKTEDQIAREKAAVESMRNAKANMDTALARIADLERSIAYAATSLTQAKAYIGASACIFTTNGARLTVHEHIDTQVASLRKTLG